MPRGPEFQKERGEHQRRKILATLADGPLSGEEIAGKIHLSRAGVLLHIQKLRANKQVRVAEFREQSRTRELPLYGLGDSPDAVYIPIKKRPKVEPRTAIRNRFFGALKDCQLSSLDLMVKLRLSAPCVRKHLRLMREDGLIYRAAWERRPEGGEPYAIYAIGSLPDKKKPAKQVKRKRKPLTGESKELDARRRKTKRMLVAAARRPNGIFGALGL